MSVCYFSRLFMWHALMLNSSLLTENRINISSGNRVIEHNNPKRVSDSFENYSAQPPFLIVSHKGPVTLQNDGSVKLGAGGLVTTLTGISSERPITWVALNHMLLEEYSNFSTQVMWTMPQSRSFRVYLIESDPCAMKLFYDVMANEVLWFLHHSLPIPDGSKIFKNQMVAYELGYKTVNRNLADAVLQHSEDDSHPVVILQDYHAFLVAGMVRAARPNACIIHFIHIPWPPINYRYHLSPIPRLEIFTNLLQNDIIGFHTMTYCKRFLRCVSHFLGLTVDEDRGIVNVNGSKTVWVRPYPVPVNIKASLAIAQSHTALQYVTHLRQNMTEMLVVVVARSDPIKNLAGAFLGFQLFLKQHPEFHNRVSLLAHVVPSRLHIPAYQNCVREAQSLIDEINAEFTSSIWTPITLELSSNHDYAMALLRLYDVLVVNSLADGLNLIAKEGALVNERDGVLVLSTTAGVIEELGNYTINVQATDEQQLADALYTALTMSKTNKRELSEDLRRAVKATNLDKWLDDQLDDLLKKTSKIF